MIRLGWSVIIHMLSYKLLILIVKSMAGYNCLNLEIHGVIKNGWEIGLISQVNGQMICASSLTLWTQMTEYSIFHTKTTCATTAAQQFVKCMMITSTNPSVLTPKINLWLDNLCLLIKDHIIS